MVLQTIIDPHVHTNSCDGVHDSLAVVKQAKKLGIAIAITDHNTIQGSLKASKNDLGVVVVPGIEVTTKEGPHILCYFYSFPDLESFFEKHIKPNHQKGVWESNVMISVHDLIDAVYSYQGLVIPAHPFTPGLTGISKEFGNDKKIHNQVHAIEVFNANCLPKMNNDAHSWALSLDKPMTAGSDTHNMWALGIASTIVQSENTIEGILDAIKQGHCKPFGRNMNIMERGIDLIGKIKLWTAHPVYFAKKAKKDLKKSKTLVRKNV